MGFEPPAELNDTLARLRRFVDEDVIPLEGELFAKGFTAIEPALRDKRGKAKELGLWSPHMPRELGGMGLSLLSIAYVSEQLGRTPVGHYVVNMQAPDVGNMEILHAFGTEEQKEQFLLPLVRGDIRSCFAMTE